MLGFRRSKKSSSQGAVAMASMLEAVSQEGGKEKGVKKKAAEEISEIRMPFIGREIYVTREEIPPGRELMRSEGLGYTNILIREADGSYRYVVNEWMITRNDKKLINMILSDIMRFQEEYYDYLVEGRIEDVIGIIVRKYKVETEFGLRKDLVLYYVLRDTIGFGMIQPLIYDWNITDIDIRGTKPVRVKMRRFAGRWINTNVKFPSEIALKQFTSRIASLYGRGISEATPLVSFMYKNEDTNLRFRVAASYGGIKSEETTVQIRKFPPKPFLFNDLIRFGSLSPEAATAIWMMIDHKGKVAYSGPVGTGKTTLLNAALAMFDPRKKLVTIEDIEELSLKFKGNSWVPYYARGGEFYEIVKFALRITPDLMILAEVLGKELGDVIASQTGHGLAFTIHANTVEEFKLRVRMLLRMYYGENASEELIDSVMRELWSLLFLTIKGDKRILQHIYMIDIETGDMMKIYEHPTSFDLDTFLLQLRSRTNVPLDELREEFEERLNFLLNHMDLELEDFYEELVRWYNKR